PAVKQWLSQAEGSSLLQQLETIGQVIVPLPDSEISLTKEDIQIRLNAKPGWTAAQGRVGVVILSTQLSPALIAEGLARDFVHAVQNRRKELDCDFVERIEVGVVTQSESIKQAIRDYQDYIMAETLATSLQFSPLTGTTPTTLNIGQQQVELYVKPVRN
ncbi:MAG TPA: DUF5915 domain-containing protein, partial [Thermogutta sp.]|nr:DUF5915 domain-containing protein [Thermogutta sp.]